MMMVAVVEEVAASSAACSAAPWALPEASRADCSALEAVRREVRLELRAAWSAALEGARRRG
jgi:hypothetical protein